MDAGECVLSCITLSQRSTHMRCAVSESRILSRRAFPLFFLCACLLLSFSVSSGLPLIRPLPSIVPIFISGHSSALWGHSLSARPHSVFLVSLWHCVSMWSRSSFVWPHVEQIARCSCCGMFSQYCPIRCVSCSALNINCHMLRLMSLFRQLCHTAWSNSSSLFTCSTACLVMSSWTVVVLL